MFHYNTESGKIIHGKYFGLKSLK